jgi:hypothetical protein
MRLADSRIMESAEQIPHFESETSGAQLVLGSLLFLIFPSATTKM